MSDSKITSLPAVVTPAGTDLHEVVQGGINKKETTTQMLASTVADYQAADTALAANITTLNTTKANISSPTFTGIPAAPTASSGTNTTQLATTAFATTADLLRLRLSGADAMTGALNMNTHLINGVVDPVSAQDAATKNYVDTKNLLNASRLEAYNPTITSAFPITWGGVAIVKGARFNITNAGTMAAGVTVVQIGDILEALVNAPTNSAADWAVLQVNTVQATTSVIGVSATASDAQALAKSSTINTLTPSNLAALGSTETFSGLAEIATQIETNAGTDDVRYITPLKLKTNLATYSNWYLTGNTGTVDGTNYIGTLDNIPLTFRVNGEQAGRLESTINSNTFLGYKAGKSNAGGTNATALGVNSLTTNTTGIYNTALGAQTLQLNTIGNYNTAVGVLSCQNNVNGIYNTCSGYASLQSNVLGNYNTAQGATALQASTGDGNTGMGFSTLSSNISGTYNTALGYSANVSSASLTNATAIGANAIVSTSNSIVLGSGARVGIGTSSPDTSSILDLTSTTGALLVPRMTTAQKNALTPTNGMIVYDSTLGKFQGREAGAWVSFI